MIPAQEGSHSALIGPDRGSSWQDRNAALRATAAAIASAFGGRPARHAVLNGEPTVADAVATLKVDAAAGGRTEPLTVFPLFMSDGYFTP